MQLTDRIVQTKIILGTNIAEEVYIPRIITETSQNKYMFTLQMQQFPLKICYAMTTNKSRGQSLKIVGLFLSQIVFFSFFFSGIAICCHVQSSLKKVLKLSLLLIVIWLTDTQKTLFINMFWVAYMKVCWFVLSISFSFLFPSIFSMSIHLSFIYKHIQFLIFDLLLNSYTV